MLTWTAIKDWAVKNWTGIAAGLIAGFVVGRVVGSVLGL